MLRAAVVFTSAILSLSVAAVAAAKDNKNNGIDFSYNCACVCMVEGQGPWGAGGILEYHSSQPVDCGIYNDRTCNVEVSPGQIRSGKLAHCMGDFAGAAGTGSLRAPTGDLPLRSH